MGGDLGRVLRLHAKLGAGGSFEVEGDWGSCGVRQIGTGRQAQSPTDKHLIDSSSTTSQCQSRDIELWCQRNWWHVCSCINRTYCWVASVQFGGCMCVLVAVFILLGIIAFFDDNFCSWSLSCRFSLCPAAWIHFRILALGLVLDLGDEIWRIERKAAWFHAVRRSMWLS